MDTSTSQMDKSMEENSKKSPFDDLSKDELVKKCIGLLAIAQKAKQAKKEFANEYSTLKEKCQQLETQRGADKESLKTMQEFVESLTEQKLSYTTEIDGLKKQNANHKAAIKEKQDEVDKIISLHTQKIDSMMSDLRMAKESVSDMDTEITSLKRQNCRLEADNESLIKQLDVLEKEIESLNEVSRSQLKQIAELEENNKHSDSKVQNVSQSLINGEQLSKEVDFYKNSLQQVLEEKSKMAESFEEAKNNFESKCGELTKLEEEIDAVKEQLNAKALALSDTENHLSEKSQALVDNVKLYETEKIKRDRLNAKLKLYKEKIIKCSSSITQLKNSKFVLLKTVSEYSESVPKWQKDILNASKLLSEQLLCLEAENNALKAKLSTLELSTDSIDGSEIADLKNQRENVQIELENVNKKLDCTYHELSKLKEEVTTVSKEKDILVENVKSLESEKLILINEKKSGREALQRNEAEKAEIQSMCQELTDRVKELKVEIKSLREKMSLLEEENKNIAKEYEQSKVIYEQSEKEITSTLKEEITNLKISLVSVEEENKLLCEANESLKSRVEELTASLDQPNPETLEHNNMLQADISKLETKLAAYKSENATLLFEMKDSRQRLAEHESTLRELEDMKAKLSNYKSENVELLNEMKEINQVLKERGETISRQDMEMTESNRRIKLLDEELKKTKEERDSKDEEIKQLEYRLQEKESRLKMVNAQKTQEDEESLKSLRAEMENLKGLLNERDSIIISLNEDIEKLKQNQGNYTCDAPSETMSISTVSRVEESSRLKDLDESFEERYSKLRLLALKLKKRVSELTLQVKSLEDDKMKLEEEKKEAIGKLETMGSTSKNIQSIQSEYDKVVDKLEQTEVEFKANDKVCQGLRKELEKLNQDLAVCSDRNKSLEQDLDFAKKEKSALDMTIKELQIQLNSSNKNVEVMKQKDAEINQLKSDLASKESQLSAEVASHQSTKEALEKARRDVKKKSVLSLEMEDYERSMKELTTKMEDNKKKIIQMESTIDTQEATITSLKTQIKMLEEQLNTEEKTTAETKELLNMATEDLRDRETAITAKQDVIAELERKLEEASLRCEDTSLQLASALGSKEKAALSMGQEKLDLTAKLKRSENRCNETEEKLKLKVLELEELKTEFAGYKVRAQSVLRQNQTKDLSLEENLKEEMAALKSELESLRPELKATKEELEIAESERSRLSNRCSELQNTLQNERETATTQLQREAQEHKNIKLQMTTLTQCYKKQISDLEERTAEEINNLRKELDFSRVSLDRANALSKESAILEKKHSPQFATIATGAVPEAVSNHRTSTSDTNDSLGEINIALPEREEGEGSESTPSPSPTYMARPHGSSKQSHQLSVNTSGSNGRRREPVPLEQLLQGDIPDEGCCEGDLETRLQAAQKQIEMQDKRLSHMTEIVAEAEREVARRAQLGEALKEEVRRCQRALERALHHHNQEYLKNVIVKFLTLGAGDERCRLVPVLHTILTLSPEETQQLTAVAKGLDPNSNRRWGSYLPWPGKS